MRFRLRTLLAWTSYFALACGVCGRQGWQALPWALVELLPVWLLVFAFVGASGDFGAMPVRQRAWTVVALLAFFGFVAGASWVVMGALNPQPPRDL